MHIEIPDDIKLIFSKLKSSGFEGFIVGGCVRDALLNKKPNDWDICTNAEPQQIMNTFNGVCRVIPTGIKHGTVTLLINNKHFEVTTYRIDGTYSDSRRPDNVIYTKSIAEDLSRRDFTINAMAWNDCKGLIDPFNGRNDLKNKYLRCVGNDDHRIKEDYLRALRAVRFACQLSFIIDDHTVKAIVNNRKLIHNISYERIRDELCKILVSQRPSHGIQLLKEFELLVHIIPEAKSIINLSNYNNVIIKDSFKNTLAVLDNTRANLIVRLAALLINTIPEPVISKTAEMVLKRLKFDNSTIKKVCILIREHTKLFDLSDIEVKKLIFSIGIENLDNLFELIKANSILYKQNRLQIQNQLSKLRKRCDVIVKEKQPLGINDLQIDGDDLIKLGFKEGKEIGYILNNLLELVLEYPQLNNKEYLINITRQQQEHH